MRLALCLCLLACSDPGSLTINNTDPTAVLSSHAPGDIVAAGLPLTFEGTVGDAETPEIELIVEWRINGEQVCTEPADAFGAVSCDAALPWGESEVLLQVADGMGGIASASVQLQATRCFEDEDRLDGTGYSSSFGSLDDGDQAIDGNYVDNFAFEAAAGDEMAFHVFSEDFDARLELYDPSCERVLAADDGGRLTNPFVSTMLPEAGTWTLVVSASAGGIGDYLVERIDDSTTVGNACGRETPTLNLLDAPYSDSHSGSLDPSDQQWGPNVGNNFYFDDIEFYAFYGDEVTLVHESSAYVPTLSFFFFDPSSGGCGLDTYDANDDADGISSTTATINRTGIYAALPWARFSGSTGAYTVTGTASF